MFRYEHDVFGSDKMKKPASIEAGFSQPKPKHMISVGL